MDFPIELVKITDHPGLIACQLITGRILPEDQDFDAELWDRLTAAVQLNGLAPMLYWVLNSRNWTGGIPETVRRKLTEAYYSSTAHNTLLWEEAKKVLAVLHENGIPVVVLKGAALAPALYATPGLRPMLDVDLLVKRTDLKQAQQLFRRLGYQEGLKDQVPGMLEMSDYHLGLVGGPGGGVKIELHWGLVASPLAWYAAPMDWFWQHIEPFSEGEPAFQLTPVAHLLYLTAHALLQHGAQQVLLIWLYDMHLLVNSGLVQWDELIEEAGRLRWGGVVEQALRMTQAVFDTRLPDGILERLSQKADPQVARLMAFKLSFQGGRLLYDWYSLIALRGMPRLRYAVGMIFPNAAYMRWRYQPRYAWLWPAYYPYRWMRMMAEGWMALRRGILRAVR